MAPVLDLRSLNRATLARQHLLERASLPVEQLAAAIGGLPARGDGRLVGAWARIAGISIVEPARAGESPADGSPEQLVRRHLAAWGPATVADVRGWCRRPGIGDAVASMLARGELVELASWTGAELVDLPDAPRPRGDVPAPPRLLPAGDALLRGLVDRERIVDPAHRELRGASVSSRLVLVDGFLHGSWRIERDATRVVLQVEPFGPLAGSAEQPLVREATALLELLHPTAHERVVRLG